MIRYRVWPARNDIYIYIYTITYDKDYLYEGTVWYAILHVGYRIWFGSPRRWIQIIIIISLLARSTSFLGFCCFSFLLLLLLILKNYFISICTVTITSSNIHIKTLKYTTIIFTTLYRDKSDIVSDNQIFVAERSAEFLRSV